MEDGALLYGLPSGIGSELGVKIGFHTKQMIDLHARSPPPKIPDVFLQEITKATSSVFNGLEYYPRLAKWCIYTMAADEYLIIGRSAEMIMSITHPHVLGTVLNLLQQLGRF